MISAGRPAWPQNNSCPAGGTIEGRVSARPFPNLNQIAWHSPKEGVIVAPPSGNTGTQGDLKMHVVHRGFDTIALSIQANISKDLFDLPPRDTIVIQ